jgi:phosphoenolpyruvate-protein kinase (PTS system EI component)
MARIQGPRPERREVMVETPAQMAYVARLYARLDFRYIIGWRDVRGYGVMALKRSEWETSTHYINLRLS